MAAATAQGQQQMLLQASLAQQLQQQASSNKVSNAFSLILNQSNLFRLYDKHEY